MSNLYFCYLPTRGETLDVATPVKAFDPTSAAEKFAAKTCWDDTEWEDHLVAVGFSRFGPEERFEVQFETGTAQEAGQLD